MELIIGRGRYGSYAVEFLRNKNRDFTIVDVNKDCQAVRRLKINAAGSLQKSGENFVVGNLEKAV